MVKFASKGSKRTQDNLSSKRKEKINCKFQQTDSLTMAYFSFENSPFIDYLDFLTYK